MDLFIGNVYVQCI